MGNDIVTAHLSDYREDGKMCLPGKGVTDFKDVFKRLDKVGFDGAILIEAYQSDYDKETELIESLEYLTKLAQDVFGRKIN